MYNSGVGNDPRNRTFNIQLQASRYDSNGSYQELWLEE
jgi:deoxyribodipyrimidine photo-lyase